MERLVKYWNLQRILLVAGVLIIFVLFILYLFYFNKKATPVSPENLGENPSNVTLQGNSQIPQTKYYENLAYSISYPSSWDVSTRPVVGRGSLDSFVANKTVGGEAFPRVDIQVTPVTSTSATIRDLVNNLSILQFKQDSAVFHGKPATRLSGSINLSFDEKNGATITKKVNKTFMFLEYNGYIYIVDYAYLEDGTEKSALELINPVLDSYEFR